MKAATKLALLLLVVIMTLSPIAAAETGPAYPPHEEPGTAPSTIDPASLLAYMSGILGLISQNNHDGANALIGQFNLTSLPSSLSPLFSTYIEQTASANDEVQRISSLINETSAFLNEYDTSGANQTLSQAGITIGEAQILLNDLESTSTSIGGSLGAFGAPQGSPSALAYAGLQGSNQNLSDLVSSYLKILLSQRARLIAEESQIGNVTTSLTLASNTSAVWLGDSVQLYGILESNDSGLADKNITILMDGNDFASAITDASGNFTLSFSMPFVYEDSALFVALYAPMGGDMSVYLPSESQPISIQLLFYKASLVFASPSVGYPGMPLSVQGNVTFEGAPLAGSALQIFLDGVPVASAGSNSSGGFSTSFALDPQTGVGMHQLTASLLPSGLYGEVNKTNSLQVEQLPIKVALSYPGFALMPGTVTITGKADYSSTPINNATVVVSLANSSQTMITQDGAFSSNFNLPFGLWLVGFQKISVTVTPSEPWYAQYKGKAQVFVVNPASVAASLIAAAAIAIFSISRYRRNSKLGGMATGGGPVIEQNPPQFPSPLLEETPGIPLPTSVTASTLSAGLNKELRPERHRIIESYLRAAGFIETKTGLRMELDMTINEFMSLTAAKLDGVASRFSDLTLLAERSLYSQNEPTQKEAAKAEDYSESLFKQFGNENK